MLAIVAVAYNSQRLDRCASVRMYRVYMRYVEATTPLIQVFLLLFTDSHSLKISYKFRRVSK